MFSMFSPLRAHPTDCLFLFSGNRLTKKEITMAESNEYISITRKNFLADDNKGRMVEKSFLEIQGTFLVKIHDNTFNGIIGENAFKHIENFLKVEIETDEDDGPDDIAKIFKIKDNLFDYETPLCKAFNEFNYLLKINTDLFTFDIQEIKTYEEYELNNNMTGELKEPWSENGVPYQLCDHICEPYHFKNGKTKWPTCSSDIDGFCNGGELPGMVRVGCMTYFQDHKWYDELTDGKLKEEALIHKARIEESWGDATPGIMKFCEWLKNSFENFHELDYDVLVKLEEYWWKVNAQEKSPFARWENHGQGSFANTKTRKDYDPYLDTNHILGGDYGSNNVSNIQDNMKEYHNPSIYKIRRFKMMKYSFDADDEYVAIKEHEHSRTDIDACQAYRELFCIMDEGWFVTKA
ncbi:hypothetical protein Tco_1319106 [Tanacetum coccineum]